MYPYPLIRSQLKEQVTKHPVTSEITYCQRANTGKSVSNLTGFQTHMVANLPGGGDGSCLLYTSDAADDC